MVGSAQSSASEKTRTEMQSYSAVSCPSCEHVTHDLALSCGRVGKQVALNGGNNARKLPVS